MTAEKILSQEEVDALLKGVETGDIETESPIEGDSDVIAYDFTRQERIVRGRMPGLEMANDRFSRLFRDALSSVLMKFVDVNIQSVETVMFSEFMKAIPIPSSINIFKMPPLKGYALFVMEAPMVFALIEYFFGGGSNLFTKSEGRYFTAIEQRVIKKISMVALDSLEEAWTGLHKIKPEYVGLEMNPQFVSIVTPTEGVVKIDIHIDIEEFSGKAFFCIPYSMVEPIKEKLFSGIKGDKLEMDERWVSRVKSILRDSYVDISVEMGKVELTLKELMGLKKGNVITLGSSTSDSLLVRVQDVPKYLGMPGVRNGAQAVKITRILSKKGERDV